MEDLLMPGLPHFKQGWTWTIALVREKLSMIYPAVVTGKYLGLNWVNTILKVVFTEDAFLDGMVLVKNAVSSKFEFLSASFIQKN